MLHLAWPFRIAVLITTVVVAALESAGPAQAGEPPNLLRNPGAEEGKKAEPSFWFRASVPVEGLRLWRALDQAHSGKACLAIANTHQYEHTVCNNWAQELQEVPVGRTIRLSAYVKTAAVDNVNLCIQCWDGTKKEMLAFASTPTLVGDGDWKSIATTPVVVPPQTAAIVVRAVLTGKGRVWFDDLNLAVVEQGESGAVEASPHVAPTCPPPGRGQAGESPSLLRNPGVEQGKEAEPSDWFRVWVPAEGLRMWRAVGQAHSGEACLAIANTHQYDQRVWNNWAQELQEVPVGRSIRLSAYVKTVGADNVSLCIQCWDDTKTKLLGIVNSSTLRGDQPWTVVTTPPLLVPPKTAAVMVRAVLEGNGQVWFDDLDLAVVEGEESGAVDERLHGVWTGYEEGREQVKWVALFCPDKAVLVGTSGEGGCGIARTDTTRTPHCIDATATCSCSAVEATGATVLGIYQIAGNTLKLCLNRPGAPARPPDFGAVGSRVLLLTREE